MIIKESTGDTLRSGKECTKSLYDEHRVIAGVIGAMYNPGSAVDEATVKMIAEFFREYADRIHHGKEEKIFFMKLAEKDMSKEDKGFVNELVEEHKQARILVKSLIGSEDPKRIFRKMVSLYAFHIQKEDMRLPAIADRYFSDEEEHGIKEEFDSFDNKEKNKDYTEMIDKIIESLR